MRDFSREVLLTDGLGGFSLSTLHGVPTRSYSGLAVSFTPPVERHVMWIAARETLAVEGRRTTLHAFEVAPLAFEGEGLGCVERVNLTDLLPERVQFALGTRVRRRAFMPRHSGALVLLYEVEASETGSLTLGGLFTDRDMHAVRDELPALTFERDADSVTIRGGRFLRVRLRCEADVTPLEPHASPQRLHLRAEAERGEASTDVAASVDLWRVTFEAGTHRFALVIDGLGDASFDPWQAWQDETARRRDLVERAWSATGVRDEVVATLAVAADAFLVRRESTNSTSVIAGYPWFADWGRDAMIALRGLTLVTGRFEEARELLETFLRYEQEGLVPNNFFDDGSGAGYNTVDGSLWLFVAFEAYVHATGDEAFARRHLPQLRRMIDDLARGTRFSIRLHDSGLLRAGEKGVQLTWMDVKIHDWVVTPRHGRPIEIAALWLSALDVHDRLAARLGEAPAFEALRAKGRAAMSAFWRNRSFPADVLSDDGSLDTSIRPNALLALSHLDAADVTARALLTARRDLLTPVGLRTLSPTDERYRPTFGGHRFVRDSAYHQGTVWPWLIGAYTDLARDPSALSGLVAHLSEAGVGSVSEVFGGSDLVPGGCPFQAWSVAELLRAYVQTRSS
ncbi:putative glycogen debranching enzyme [Deinococcus yavapaiensis KR-236]|uniref:Putative glycogen debranching enzyme n=1 Tax=Deinococcus yavapaiensis KR-236 TaxID=694435 RepID=A0A318SCX6_9DEIO|nr:putative glycogen debranching enzyme [Deinococcus yavapaiensis KR-236]